MNTLDLCGPCAAMMGESYNLRKVSFGIDKKVTCDNCGRRRFGGAYVLTLKKRTPPKGATEK